MIGLRSDRGERATTVGREMRISSGMTEALDRCCEEAQKLDALVAVLNDKLCLVLVPEEANRENMVMESHLEESRGYSAITKRIDEIGGMIGVIAARISDLEQRIDL